MEVLFFIFSFITALGLLDENKRLCLIGYSGVMLTLIAFIINGIYTIMRGNI